MHRFYRTSGGRRLRLATAIVTLAAWRWRRQWFLLLVTGIGIITALILICAIPLFTTVMMTGGLHGELTAAPQSSEIFVDISSGGLSARGVRDISQLITPVFQRHLGAYVSGSPRLDVQMPDFPVGNGDEMGLYGASIAQAAAHLTLLQGRLPQTLSKDFEVAMTVSVANQLGVRVGSTYPLTIFFHNYASSGLRPRNVSSFASIEETLALHVVGLFEVKQGDPYWHGQDFKAVANDKGQILPFLALVSSSTLLNAFDAIASAHGSTQVFFSLPSHVYWYYMLDRQRVSLDRLDDLVNQLAAVQGYITTRLSSPGSASQPPYIQGSTVNGLVFSNANNPSILEKFRDQMGIVQIPSAILALEITCLVLFFVNAIVGLLVERQAETIAILRSRGASIRQIFGALMTQSIIISIGAFLVGPPLALVAVYFIAPHLLPSGEQEALSAISAAPWQALWSVRWYALVAVVMALATMVFSLYQAVRLDVLIMRRQSARSTRRPLWQRLRLDIFAMIIALSGYVISVYLANTAQLLDTKTQVLVSSPLALITPIFLLIAGILFFLRFFPSLLRSASHFAVRGRGASPMLALAHMSRAPRQAMRMALLLGLATAFAIFTLIFAASQSQRAQDVAAYQAGADFSGVIAVPGYPVTVPNYPLQAAEGVYERLPGVQAAAIGYGGTGQVQLGTNAYTSPTLTVQIRAVDAEAFARAAIWSERDGSQAIDALMSELIARRQAGIASGVVPTIVDATTWNALHLHPGATFSMVDTFQGGDTLQCLALAEVAHIPTVNDSSQGGVFFDYATYATVKIKRMNRQIPANYIWLHTTDEPATLSHLRAVLNQQLSSFYDRRAIVDSIYANPLSLNLLGILSFGATAALLLALLANILVPWLGVRGRLTSFTVLRALGTAPKQVVSVLTWEQGVVFAAALLLGVLFGSLLSITTVPALIFTGIPFGVPTVVTSSTEFYAVQRTLPAQVVLPLSLGFALVALVLICVLALSMMTRAVMQPSIGQALRINED